MFLIKSIRLFWHDRGRDERRRHPRSLGMKGKAEIERIVALATQRYGSLVQPRFHFLEPALMALRSSATFRSLAELPAKFTDDTDLNTDLSLAINFETEQGIYLLRISLVAAYACFCLVNAHNQQVVIEKPGSGTSFERAVAAILVRDGFVVLSRDLLVAQIGAPFEDSTTDESTVFRLLFADEYVVFG